MTNIKFDIQRRKNVYGMPIIKIVHKATHIACLFDTGANIPVWCSGEEELKYYYKDCYKQNAVFMLAGFGKGQELAKAYIIPNFELSDGKNTIHYKNLLVAVIERDFSFDMILSYTMFNKMNISIDAFTNRNGTHNVVPNLKIASQKAEYNVGYKIAELSTYNKTTIAQKYGIQNILDSIYIFSQQ